MKQRVIGLKMFLAGVLVAWMPQSWASLGNIKYNTDPNTGAISSINIDGDVQNMNWVITTDGSQYNWIDRQYSWGLGYFTERKGSGADCRTVPTEAAFRHWEKPEAATGSTISYRAGDVLIEVERQLQNGCLLERYTFTNKGKNWTYLEDLGIYTPFNDNYPDSRTCLTARCNAHIWAGEDGAYVFAERMGAAAPHMGLQVTEGKVVGYDIWARGRKTSNSHARGVIALTLPDLRLRPNQSYAVAWSIGSYDDKVSFKNHLKGTTGLAWADKYTYEKGETAHVVFEKAGVKNCTATLNGMPIDVKLYENKAVAEIKLLQAGTSTIEFHYGNHKQTPVDILVFDNISRLIDQRAKFILSHQQMNIKTDPRYGAFMVYDCEADSIYLNDKENCNPVDRDEGAERVGMGVFLAKYYRLSRPKDQNLKSALIRYADFLRDRLQTSDYTTYSSVDKSNRNRAYNYPWIAEFYFHMYFVTGDKKYANDGYQTLKSMFRQFGHSFYAIGFPVQLGLECLKEAGLKAQYNSLLQDFEEEGAYLVKNSLNYPKSEVNYEQSIVAPAVQFLAQMYLITHDAKYLDEVKKQMPVVEAFNGFQPSYHLNEISIRHWDGHWFGKYELFGDTFPHYWSTVTASVYHLYAQCTGSKEYRKKAENIVRNNLCLFSEDGKASCAYLYPNHINGVRAKFYDPYANDQDWALVYYLQVMRGI